MIPASARPGDSLHRAAQAFGTGDMRSTLRLLRDAVDADPMDADRHYALGRCLRALQDDAGAEVSYRHALALRPAFTDAWISLGILLRHLGRHTEAESAQREALAIEPNNFLAQLNLGNVLLSQGRADEAAAAFQAAIAANEGCAEAHNNLARLLVAQGERSEAARHFAQALAINPAYFEAASGAGELLLAAEQHANAVAPLTVAARLRPTDNALRQQLGRALSGAGRYAAAITEFETVLRSMPRDRDTRFDLALAQFYSGQYTKPRAALEALIEERDDDPFVSLAYSSLLLRAGEFRTGWRHYTARWKTQSPGLRALAEPMWQGESLAGKTLLISREQGLGDEIMFASIFAEILEEAAHCIIECEQRLVPLFRRTFATATVFGVDKDDERWDQRLDSSRELLPSFDCWTTLGDLGRFRRNEARDFPRRCGYLVPDATRVEFWRNRFAVEDVAPLTVGLGWRGGTQRSRAGERSLSLDDLKPLLSVPNIRFVSLQYGPCTEEVAAFSRANGIRLDHWQESVDDIDDYAALIASLDLVVSVCSAVIHLGGALGRPVWVLAPQVPEWRYGREGEHMIWYPSVRMFRQEKARDWDKVIGKVRRALVKLPGATGRGAE